MSYNLKRLLQYSSLEITKEFTKVLNPSRKVLSNLMAYLAFLHILFMCSANDKVLSKMTPVVLANYSVGAIIPLCVCPLKFISTFVPAHC